VRAAGGATSVRGSARLPLRPVGIPVSRWLLGEHTALLRVAKEFQGPADDAAARLDGDTSHPFHARQY